MAPTGSGLLTDGRARPKPVPTIIRAFEAPHNGGSDERIVVLGIGDLRISFRLSVDVFRLLVLVPSRPQLTAVDFGVGRVTDRETQTSPQTIRGQLVGTLAYMSPEQVLADPLELDTRSDVYALGVILYERRLHRGYGVTVSTA